MQRDTQYRANTNAQTSLFKELSSERLLEGVVLLLDSTPRQVPHAGPDLGIGPAAQYKEAATPQECAFHPRSHPEPFHQRIVEDLGRVESWGTFRTVGSRLAGRPTATRAPAVKKEA